MSQHITHNYSNDDNSNYKNRLKYAKQELFYYVNEMFTNDLWQNLIDNSNKPQQTLNHLQLVSDSRKF